MTDHDTLPPPDEAAVAAEIEQGLIQTEQQRNQEAWDAGEVFAIQRTLEKFNDGTGTAVVSTADYFARVVAYSEGYKEARRKYETKETK